MANDLYCSFCGKSHKEVMKLIAGPTVFICDECVFLCLDIVTETYREKAKEAASSGDDLPPQPSSAPHDKDFKPLV